MRKATQDTKGRQPAHVGNANMESGTISFTDFRGGLSTQSNRGPRGAFYGGYALDIRNGDNTLKCNQALKKDSGAIVTDFIRAGFKASDGNNYAFGDTGKIYRKISGTWSVVYTDTGKITGAYEFVHNDGAGNYIPYLVWATKTKLMQTKLSDTTFASVTTAGTFALGTEPHTMRMASGMLMVCDGNYIALLDYQGAYNSQGLNIAGGNNGNALYERNDEVIIGTVGNGSDSAWLFSWNGSALSWLLKRPAQGSIVNALIPLELGMMLQAGNEGYLRYWNYSDVGPLKRVTNQGSPCLSSYPEATVEYHTIPYIGMNGGNRGGVYSVGRLDKNDVLALNLEYIPSAGFGAEIGALWRDGDDMYVSWKQGTSYGIDIIDHTTKATAVWESLENDVHRPDAEKVIRSIKLLAKTAIPTGCSVIAKVKASRDSTWVDLKSNDDGTAMVAGELKRIFNAENMGELFAIQLTLIPSGNTTPEIIGVFAHFDIDNDL